MGDAGQDAPTGTLRRTSAVAAVYDRTIETAFGLAFRITGERGSATAACEAAYAEALDETGEWDRARELALLGRVRGHALQLRPGTARTDSLASSYQREEAVRERLASADPAGRRAIELCYFSGMTADEAAEILGLEPAEVRAAMRSVLLALGASASKEIDGA